MTKKINWLISDQHVTVNFDGATHIVPLGTDLANHLIEALKTKNYDDIPDLISTAKRIEKLSKGEFYVDDGKIMVNGVEAPAALGSKILKFSNQGLPFQPLVKFAGKIQGNPSFRAVNELFQFLEKNDHPITDSGNFIAYKRVRSDFTDIHSGTFDNSVGKLVEMPRNQVNEDPDQTCSYGLHVANWDYAHTKFASHEPATDIMLEVEVNPADVVAVPSDYDQSKMRVCKYKVLGVVDKENSTEVQVKYTSVNNQDPCHDAYLDEEDDDEDEDDAYPFEDELDLD